MSNQEVRKGEELPAVKLKQFLQENSNKPTRVIKILTFIILGV